MNGITKTTIFIIFSIFILIITFTVFFASVWPRVWPIIRSGPCWGSFKGGIDNLVISKEKTQAILIGDCVEELAFVNDLNEYKNEDVSGKCKDGKAFILGIPRVPGVKEKWYKHPIKWLEEKIKGKFKGFQQWILAIKPFCKTVDREFKSAPEPINGPEKGKEIYCITLSKSGNYYTVTSKQVEKEEECKL
jgi:hypothetical protein